MLRQLGRKGICDAARSILGVSILGHLGQVLGGASSALNFTPQSGSIQGQLPLVHLEIDRLVVSDEFVHFWFLAASSKYAMEVMNCTESLAHLMCFRGSVLQ